jgi:hypothetical protein
VKLLKLEFEKDGKVIGLEANEVPRAIDGVVDRYINVCFSKAGATVQVAHCAETEEVREKLVAIVKHSIDVLNDTFPMSF